MFHFETLIIYYFIMILYILAQLVSFFNFQKSSISHRWTFPAFHYAIDYTLTDGTSMRIITVDTILLCGMEVGQNNDPEGYPADKEYAKWAWAWIDRLTLRINSHAVGI